MKKMTVEAFLHWAFVQELPKGGGSEGLSSAGSAWAAIEGVSQLGTRIDVTPGDYAHSGWFEQGEAHPDAVAAGRSVARLAYAGIGVPDDWNPVRDWTHCGDLEREAVERAIKAANGRGGPSLVALVVRMAVLNRAPEFEAPQPRRRFVMKRGKPAWFVQRAVKDCLGRKRMIEANGFDAKRQRPLPKAYRRHELASDPVPALMGRADYQLWRAGLDWIFEDLDGRLEAHRLERPAREWWPWEAAKPAAGAPAAGRVFAV